jgi:ferredoxin
MIDMINLFIVQGKPNSKSQEVKMKREIITIDEEKCTGCGLCIPNCPEGALQIIDGKARLLSDIFCDGLGACIGHCPEDAISVEEREAEEYDECLVMSNIVKQGANTIKAHLDHLSDHNQHEYLQQAIGYLEENNIEVPFGDKVEIQSGSICGCPGSHSQTFSKAEKETSEDSKGIRLSRLTHWPIQMHLLAPFAPHYRDSDLLLAADCVAFSLGDFHKDYLNDKTLAIACPKLDEGQDIYLDKLKTLIDEAKINSLTVMIMQVPCCGGLLHLARTAAEQATRKVQIKCVVVGLEGEILREDYVN